MCRGKIHSSIAVLIILLAFSALGLTGCPDSQPPPEENPGGAEYTPDHPANNGDVHGVVYVDRAPRAFGTVQIFDDELNMLAECRCDAEGVYEMTDFVPGSYLIRYLNSVGNQLGEDQEFEIKAGRDITLDLRYTT